MTFKPRSYRQWIKNDDLVYFEVKEGETDLAVSAERTLTAQARQAVLNCRAAIARYLRDRPEFFSSLEPVEVGEDAPGIVRAMAGAAARAGVGPMAAVAGAIAESVGRELLAFSGQVIVENGGDIFLVTSKPRTLGVFAGERSPFTGKIALELPPSPDGLGVCSSSGTVSHSLSFGASDATLVLAGSAALADAVATAAGNVLKGPDDMERAIDFARAVEGVTGVLIIAGSRMGSWGQVTLL